jgi:hypothetical protein
MVITARFLLLLLAAVFFAVAAVWTPPGQRVALVPAGLCLLAIAFLVS